jgi:ribosome biogenesis GTPase A
MQQAMQPCRSGSEASTSGRPASVWGNSHPFLLLSKSLRQISCSCQATTPQKAQTAKSQQKIQTQQLTLPASDFARVKKAVYVSSSVDLKGCPPQSHPEFAVIGRSNVGKSSLINMLTQSNKLAKVSKNPGGR